MSNGGASTVIGPELKGNLERNAVLRASEMSWESKEKLAANLLPVGVLGFLLLIFSMSNKQEQPIASLSLSLSSSYPYMDAIRRCAGF